MAVSLRRVDGGRSPVHDGFLCEPLSSLRNYVKSSRNFFNTQIIMFSDLECDYINPIDLCNKLNQVCAFFSVFANRLTYVTPS